MEKIIRLTVIIATKNRPDKIFFCVQKLLPTITKRCEIIIIDQSDDSQTHNAIKKLHSKCIAYFKICLKGKSAALNFGVTQARGEIIAFTDDDCVVSNNWINEIRSVFDTYPKMSCVTGNTLPYGNIPSWACPAILKTNFNIFTKPIYHAQIGFGNNMAIRKNILKSVGPFKSWLGPGSAAMACEDGEMIQRLLIHGYSILHNPCMLVYHNKRLNTSQLANQDLSYVCGEMACYGYYSLSGYTFAMDVIKNNCIDSLSDVKHIFIHNINRNTTQTDEWKYSVKKLVMRINGFMIGTFYSFLAIPALQ
jgi:glycosyltransferase involved in cell wall biosynthesis